LPHDATPPDVIIVVVIVMQHPPVASCPRLTTITATRVACSAP
jgi:hypothetical protein